MSDNTLSAKVSVSADASPVQKLIKVLESLEKVLAQAANTIPAATEALALFGGAVEATTQASSKAVKAAGDLNKSLGDSSGVQTSSRFLKNYVATINELRSALNKGGAKPENLFGDSGQALAEIRQLEAELLSLVNVYRTGFGRGELLAENFDTRGAIKELNELRSVVEELSTSAQSGAGIDFNIKGGVEELQKFEAILSKINNIGVRPANAELALATFGDLRQEANLLATEAANIQNELAKIGPSAVAGSSEAIAQMGQLSQSLADVQNRAANVGSQLNLALQSFGKQTAGKNFTLRELGFEEIKLEDIFPTSEQQKVADLQRKIDQAVRASIEEGAVRDTLNFFLAQDRQIQSVDRNVIALTSHLPRLRYALYDVSNTAGIFGGTIVAAIGATVKLAADYERSFADVVRTTGVAGAEAEALRNSLVDLSQSIPVSFAELADIATLAGQLNIASGVIDDFTETVAKFAATTDVTIEASATAFGRLDQLVDGVNGQFERLGSSILKVGVNAVATESDIIAIATQIASVANIAGFSADELIGFSSALASVGTRPELARGTFTRLFTEIQQSVAGGGDQLDAFARTAGQSVEEFTSAWGAGSGAEQVIAVLEGLNVAGTQADQVLAQLGITSVRDVPTLLKLAQNIEEVKQQLFFAKIGFEEGVELQDQYGIITETLTEKLEVLKNNLSAVVAAFGSISGPLGLAVDGLNKLLNVIEFIVKQPLGQLVVGVASALAGLVGIGSLAVSVFARFGASFTGAATAMVELKNTIALTKLQIAQLADATNVSVSADLKKTASTRVKAAAEAKSAVIAKKAELATNSQTISTIRYNTSLSALRLRLISTSASVKAYAANIRLAGAAALVAAQQTKAYGLAVKGLRAATGVAAFLAITALIEGVISKQEELSKETLEASERFEDWGSIIEAVKQDTTDFASATEENIDDFIILGNTVGGTTDEISNYSKIVATATGNEDELAEFLGKTTEAFEGQTVAVGKNTKAILAQKLAKELAAATEGVEEEGLTITDTLGSQRTRGSGAANRAAQINEERRALSALISTLGTDLSTALSQSGFDFEEWSNAVLSGNQELANSIAQDLEPAAQKLLTQFRSQDPVKFASEIQLLESIVNGGSGALTEFASSGTEVFEMIRQAQIEISALGGVFDETEGDIESFSDTFGAMVDQIFGPVNAQREMEESIIAVGGAFQTLGADAAATSVEMQDAIKNIVVAADGDLNAAVDGLAGFYQAIVDGGYASGEQLELLQTIIIDTYRTAVTAQMESLKQAENAIRASIALARISPRSGGARARGGALSENIAQQESLEASLATIQNINSANVNSANSANLLAQGYDNARKSAAGTRDEVEEIEEETRQATRTLLDYAGDLESVFSRAFDIRFGRTFALDDIAESFQKLSESVEDARFELEELQASQSDLSADRGIKEYFLSIAEAYNDTLRAAKLREEIAALDREQAENQERLEEAQAIAGGDLAGQGPGQRQNRQALLGLVQNYQDYIKVLAESGASQDELRAATAQARAEFIQQATELGFQEDIVLQYAQAFDDVTFAINNVPRNITIDFDANPALLALRELNARLDETIEKTNKLNKLGGVERDPYVPPKKVPLTAVLAEDLEIRLPPTRITFRPGFVGFAEGGFTGQGGRNEPAGIVHRGEYVVPKQYVNQSTGMPDPSFLAQMQSGMRNYFNGGFVGGGSNNDGGAMMVELSPFDRKLLADAGNVQLRLNGRVVAEATNQNNFDEARRGSN